MRERWALGLALSSGAILVLMAALLATWQNRMKHGPETAFAVGRLPSATAPTLPQPEPALLARGRATYDRENCRACHSIAGLGNRRLPLDSVGARRDGTELRHWIIAGPSIADSLSRRARIRKASGPNSSAYWMP